MLMTLWLPSPTFAQGTPGEQGAVAVSPATSPERSAAEKQATGTVVSVSENKKTLVVEANGKKIIFWVAERAVEERRRGVEDPAIASNPEALQERLAALEAARGEVDRLYARWAELEAKQA
jgi:hypothetical protein